MVLISTILNFETARPSLNNGLAYALNLPTYAADAWYHKRLPADLQQDLKTTLKEVENWTMTGYLQALNKQIARVSGRTAPNRVLEHV